MQKWKKIMSALLVTGMLMTAGAGLALADTAEASAPERPAGPKGGLLLNEEWLTEQIAGLSAEQQAEILALQEQLEALQPEQPERTFASEQRSVLEEYQAQIQAKEDAVMAVFAEAGVTLSVPERGERLQGDGDKPESDSLQPERPADTEKEMPEGSRPLGGRGGKAMSGVGLVSETDLAQLDSNAQAEVQALQTEIKALQAEMRTALGLDRSEQSAPTEEDKAAEAEARSAREALLEALQEAGIVLPQPPTRENVQ